MANVIYDIIKAFPIGDVDVVRYVLLDNGEIHVTHPDMPTLESYTEQLEGEWLRDEATEVQAIFAWMAREMYCMRDKRSEFFYKGARCPWCENKVLQAVCAQHTLIRSADAYLSGLVEPV